MCTRTGNPVPSKKSWFDEDRPVTSSRYRCSGCASISSSAGGLAGQQHTAGAVSTHSRGLHEQRGGERRESAVGGESEHGPKSCGTALDPRGSVPRTSSCDRVTLSLIRRARVDGNKDRGQTAYLWDTPQPQTYRGPPQAALVQRTHGQCTPPLTPSTSPTLSDSAAHTTRTRRAHRLCAP